MAVQHERRRQLGLPVNPAELLDQDRSQPVRVLGREVRQPAVLVGSHASRPGSPRERGREPSPSRPREASALGERCPGAGLGPADSARSTPSMGRIARARGPRPARSPVRGARAGCRLFSPDHRAETSGSGRWKRRPSGDHWPDSEGAPSFCNWSFSQAALLVVMPSTPASANLRASAGSSTVQT
jgi:hypothetical protein